jgi:rod shape-determining protein MreD
MSDKFLERSFHQVKFLLIGTYVLAITLSMFSLRGDWLILLPPIALLMIFFWSVHLLNQSHLFTALFLGVIYDVLFNSLLGLHALLFIVLTFFMLRMRLRFRSYRLWHQSVVIGFYMAIYQALHYVLLNPLLNETTLWYYGLMPLAASIIWPCWILISRPFFFRTSS